MLIGMSVGSGSVTSVRSTVTGVGGGTMASVGSTMTSVRHTAMTSIISVISVAMATVDSTAMVQRDHRCDGNAEKGQADNSLKCIEIRTTFRTHTVDAHNDTLH